MIVRKRELGNMIFGAKLTFTSGKKVYCDRVFYRLKDAKLYLSAFKYKEFFRIITKELNNENYKNKKVRNNHGIKKKGRVS